MRIKIALLFIVISSRIYAQNVNLNIGEVNSKNYYQEIGFELINEKIIVPVEIEGKQYRFILDTGAPNIVSKEIKDIIKPKDVQSISTMDANGKRDTLEVVLIESLKLGKITFKQTANLVYDLESSPIFNCFKVDGFIGSNMLRNSIVQINTKKKTLILTDKKKSLSLNKKESSRMKLLGIQSSPYFWIRLKGNNSGKEHILIDTGASGLYDLSMKNYRIFEDREIFRIVGKSEGASSIGLFGDVPKNNHYKLLLPSLNINGIELNNVISITTNDNNSRLGAELLEYGIITIDFKHKRFYFNPYSANNDVLKPDFGFTRTFKNNKLIIGFVWEEELKSLIKYGDEIVAINDNEITESNLCDLVLGNINLEKNNSIKLRLKSVDGKIFEIVIDKKLPSSM